MADFTAPFHAPRWTTEEFKIMKAEYVKKHGYTVTIPALTDIIHIIKFKPMTKREKQLWAQRRYDEIPPRRRRDIEEEKARKKAKFLAMLGDPSPEIARSAGALLTAIDDTQDAVSTLACIGMIAAAVIGGPVAAAVLGPLGLILGASTFMNVINPYSHLRRLLKKSSSGRGAKKNMEKLTDKNPFSKKAKVKLAKRLLKFRPSLGNLCELLQTTDQIFGIGICLGPIIGFAQGALSGVVRTAMGEKVEWKKGWPEKNEVEKAAAAAAIANVMTHMTTWQSDADDEMRSTVAASLSMQVLYESLKEWNPIDHIEDLGSHLVQAPQPTDPLTLELIAEEGIPIDKLCVWPQNGKQWMSIDDIQKYALEKTAANLAHYAAQNNHDLGAFNALACADDFALNFLGAFEGEDQIEVDFLVTERVMICILDNGWEYPDGVTEAQVQKFEDWVYVHEYMNTNPSAKEIMYYAEVHCGFTWARSEREFR